jgi:hypothetical protein
VSLTLSTDIVFLMGNILLSDRITRNAESF